MKLAQRFSSRTSLLILLVLTIGTAWLFSFASKTGENIDRILSQQNDVLRSEQTARASSTLAR